MSENDDYPNISGYVSIKEAAKMLGISDKTVYYYVDQKRLPAVRAGNILLISIEEIEKFNLRSVGRPRTSTPAWRTSVKDNQLFATLINVRIRPEHKTDIVKRLGEMRREEYTFPGTVARYIMGKAESPQKLEILLVWKSSVMPDEAERERELEEFRKALADVVDWDTAQYEHDVVFMHT